MTKHIHPRDDEQGSTDMTNNDLADKLLAADVYHHPIHPRTGA